MQAHQAPCIVLSLRYTISETLLLLLKNYAGKRLGEKLRGALNFPEA